jgi:hypothetical protein
MKIRSVIDIVRGLLKKAEREGRGEEVKARIREHLMRSKDNDDDTEILDKFLYENEGQPRAVRAMNLQAQMDGEEGRVSDAILIEQSVKRRKAVKAGALSDSFALHANDDVTKHDEVEEIIARAEELNNCEGLDSGSISYAYSFSIDDINDKDIAKLVNSFVHRSLSGNNTENYAHAMVKKAQEREWVAIAKACPFPCEIG